MKGLVNFLVVTLAVGAMGSCRQQGVVYPATACGNATSVCMNDRPYVCGGGVWRPVGTTTCTERGGVCCLDRALQVHSCVAQTACGGT